MKIQITMDNVVYDSFTDIFRLNEEEHYDLSISVFHDDNTTFDLEDKGVSANLRFVDTTNVESYFDIDAEEEDLSEGLFTLDLADELTDKGEKAYFVYWQLNNTTDSKKYNILCGRLIVDKKL